MTVQTPQVDPLDRRTFYRFSWFRLFRPMTWSGSVMPALVGTVVASQQAPIRLGLVMVFVLAAVLVQSITNLWNDYFDFLHGQDAENWGVSDGGDARLGPSRQAIHRLGWVLTGVTACLGVWLSMQGGWYIAIVGAACMAVGYLYSAGPKPLSALGLGEVAAAICMGPVVTVLAYGVQRPVHGALVWFASVPMALLIGSMILTNNIRDIEKDLPSRRTVPIRIGRKHSITLLTCALLAPYAWVVLLAVGRVLPETGLLVVLALPFAFLLRCSLRSGASIASQKTAMKRAAIHHLVFGVLFIVGLWR